MGGAKLTSSRLDVRTTNSHWRHILKSVFVFFLLSPLFSTACSTERNNHNGPPRNQWTAIDHRNYFLTYQPIHDYAIPFDATCRMTVNNYAGYTRIGTNYGPVGTELRHLRPLCNNEGTRAVADGVKVGLRHNNFAGMYHSLNGIQSSDRLASILAPGGLSFDSPYGPLIKEEYQPKVVGLYIQLKGQGRLKLELKSIQNTKQFGVLETTVDFNTRGKQQTIFWMFGPKHKKQRVFQVPSTDDLWHMSGVLEDFGSVLAEPNVAFANWIAEKRSSKFSVREFGLLVQFPESLSAEDRFFLKSLGKLLKVYHGPPYGHFPGIVQDRANFPPGSFENVPTSGMFALAIAAASSLGYVREEDAIAVLSHINAVVDDALFPRHGAATTQTDGAIEATGLLPHFVQYQWESEHHIPSPPNPSLDAGDVAIPSEFSTVDTALYYHGMIAAAHILRQQPVIESLNRQIGALALDSLLIQPSAGMRRYFSHGIKSIKQKEQIIENYWDAWGGETALVILLAKMADIASHTPSARSSISSDKRNLSMQRPYEDRGGWPTVVFEGRGFIAEIQSLFYRDFGYGRDASRVDALTNSDWRMLRQKLLEGQRRRAMETFPDSSVASGEVVYGFSSGESAFAKGNYIENGVVTSKNDGRPDPILFPHYILMSASIAEDPDMPQRILKRLEDEGLFPPWGLVENMDVDLEHSFGFISSLNASFEAIGAYHYLMLQSGRANENVIYAATRNPESLPGRAIRLFYPN